MIGRVQYFDYIASVKKNLIVFSLLLLALLFCVAKIEGCYSQLERFRYSEIHSIANGFFRVRKHRFLGFSRLLIHRSSSHRFPLVQSKVFPQFIILIFLSAFSIHLFFFFPNFVLFILLLCWNWNFTRSFCFGNQHDWFFIFVCEILFITWRQNEDFFCFLFLPFALFPFR